MIREKPKGLSLIKRDYAKVIQQRSWELARILPMPSRQSKAHYIYTGKGKVYDFRLRCQQDETIYFSAESDMMAGVTISFARDENIS